jgi:hypothetical protein
MAVISCIQGVPKAAPAQFSISAQFDCLWWNESQMDGMDPNHPPPKNTRVKLKRWEYTDPVGVPHPEIVDVAVQIRNDSGRDEMAILPEVDVQWSEGALSNKASAKWGKKTRLAKPASFRLAAGETRSIRFPINIASEMAALSPARRWPWALRALVTTSASGVAVGSTQLELPIIPGD